MSFKDYLTTLKAIMFCLFLFFIDIAKHLLTIFTRTQYLQDLQDVYSTIVIRLIVHLYSAVLTYFWNALV